MEQLPRFITDERTGLEYELCGDYYIIAGEDEPDREPIGVWGQRRLNYIQKHCKPFYNKMVSEHTLYDYLIQLNRDAEDTFNYLVKQMAEREGVTELKHVEYYINIEKVRFPDMSIEYDVEATEFVLPALSVQPLVENAIKHGLMRLETGGTVKIHSYETPTHFCVEVKDDGVGFDTDAPIDEKKHVGLRNIRGRLKAMVDGKLILESKTGAGTKAVIMIPKEVTV